MSSRKYVSRTTSDLVRSQAKLFPNGTTLSKAEEDELITRWQRDGDTAARDKVAWANMGTVYACALTAYSIGGGELEDLVSEACLGFMHAFDLYDPNNGAKFSSYAYNWAKSGTMNWFDKSRNVSWRGRLTRVRRHLATKVYKRAILLTGSREKALLAVGEAIEIKDEAEVVKILHSRDLDSRYDYKADGEERESQCTSARLAHLWNPDTALVHGSSMPPAPDHATDESMRQATMEKLIRGAMGDLNEDERTVIEMGFLAHDGEQVPLTDVCRRSRTKQVSRERMRQIKEKAFDKIFRHVVDHGGIGDLLAA